MSSLISSQSEKNDPERLRRFEALKDEVLSALKGMRMTLDSEKKESAKAIATIASSAREEAAQTKAAYTECDQARTALQKATDQLLQQRNEIERLNDALRRKDKENQVKLDAMMKDHTARIDELTANSKAEAKAAEKDRIESLRLERHRVEAEMERKRENLENKLDQKHREELHNMRREHDTALAQASEKYMTLETTYKEAFALKSGLETSMKEIEAGREKMVTEIESVREELVNCQKQLAASRSQALKEQEEARAQASRFENKRKVDEEVWKAKLDESHRLEIEMQKDVHQLQMSVARLESKLDSEQKHVEMAKLQHGERLKEVQEDRDDLKKRLTETLRAMDELRQSSGDTRAACQAQLKSMRERLKDNEKNLAESSTSLRQELQHAREQTMDAVAEASTLRAQTKLMTEAAQHDHTKAVQEMSQRCNAALMERQAQFHMIEHQLMERIDSCKNWETPK